MKKFLVTVLILFSCHWAVAEMPRQQRLDRVSQAFSSLTAGPMAARVELHFENGNRANANLVTDGKSRAAYQISSRTHYVDGTTVKSYRGSEQVETYPLGKDWVLSMLTYLGPKSQVLMVDEEVIDLFGIERKVIVADLRVPVEKSETNVCRIWVSADGPAAILAVGMLGERGYEMAYPRDIHPVTPTEAMFKPAVL